MRCTLRSATVWAFVGLVLSIPSPAAAQAPAGGGQTVWHALGIPQGWTALRDSTMNRRGKHPGLEKKPPLKKLADPANLASENKALSAAAKIKKEEDLAPQKKKALKYLAQMGCGCYPGVAEAFVESLADCTEEVRLTAVESIQEAAGNGCANCNSKSCCSPEVLKKLAELAFERDDHGCWKEPSEQVRTAAREALEACCPYGPPLQVLEEGDGGGDPGRKGDPGAEEDTTAPQAKDLSSPANSGTERVSSRRRYSQMRMRMDTSIDVTGQVSPASDAATQLASTQPTDPSPEARARTLAAVTKSAKGQIIKVDRETGLVLIGCQSKFTPVADQEAAVYHDYLLGTERIGGLYVVKAEKGRALARVVDLSGRIALGDSVQLKVEDPDFR